MTGLPTLWLVLGSLYVAIGVAAALRMTSRGASRAACVSALGCWPLMLPLAFSSPQPSGSGPLRDRIERCVDDLRRTMDDPAADGLLVLDDLDGLVADLARADQRLGLVDRLLSEVESPTSPLPGLQALQAARMRAIAEVEAVLDGMVELRLSIGLRSLAGNTVPVHERLRDLRARLGAVEEMTHLDLELGPR